MLKRARAVVPAALCALLLTAAPAAARTVLQHDSFQGGGQVAFYPSVGFEQVYGAIFIVPDDHPEYRICRVLAWFGPDDLGAFGLRFGEADENGGEVNNLPIWQTDEDVFQVAGSRAEMTAFDLREYDIITDVRRLRLLFRNESFAGGPGMATDTDGITPERNLISALLRDGRRFFDYTELLPMGGSTPQPPGDWIIRVDIARPNEECPRGDAPLPDAGPPVEDAGPEPDAAPEIDAAVDLDMGPPEDQGRRDAAPPQPDRGRRDAARPPVDAAPPAPDAAPADDMRLSDAGRAGPLEVSRIQPNAGSSDRNTEVIINGRGFLDAGGIVRVELSAARLLEVEALSGSTLAAIVPAGLSPGVHDLRVTRGDGQIAVLPAAFTIKGDPPPPLMLRSVDPIAVREGASVEVTVFGAGFTADTAFSVGGAPLEDVVLANGEEARGTLEVTLLAGVYDVVARRGDEVARLVAAVEVQAARRAVSDDCSATPGERGHPAWLWATLVLGLVWRRRRR